MKENRFTKRKKKSILRKLDKKMVQLVSVNDNDNKNNDLNNLLSGLSFKPDNNVPFIEGEKQKDNIIEENKENNVWLYEDILKSLDEIPGSQERIHISNLIRHAKHVELSSDLTNKIGQTVFSERGMYSILHYSNYIFNISDQPIWIEFEHFDRMKYINYDDELKLEENDLFPKKVGYLIAKDLKNKNHLIGFVVWKCKNEKIFFSNSIIHWKPFQHPVNKEEDIQEQIMSMIDLNIPDGFLEEIKILNDIKIANSPHLIRIIDYMNKISLSETVFMMACILLFNTQNIEIQEQGDGLNNFTISSSNKKSFLSNLFRKKTLKGFFENEDGLHYTPEDN